MQYYVVATIYGTEIKSKPYSTYAEAEQAQEELTQIAKKNNFALTYEIVED